MNSMMGAMPDSTRFHDLPSSADATCTHPPTHHVPRCCKLQVPVCRPLVVIEHPQGYARHSTTTDEA